MHRGFSQGARILDEPLEEPREVVSAVPEGRTSSQNMDAAISSVDDGEAAFAGRCLSDLNGFIDERITVEEARLEERVDLQEESVTPEVAAIPENGVCPSGQVGLGVVVI